MTEPFFLSILKNYSSPFLLSMWLLCNVFITPFHLMWFPKNFFLHLFFYHLVLKKVAFCHLLFQSCVTIHIVAEVLLQSPFLICMVTITSFIASSSHDIPLKRNFLPFCFLSYMPLTNWIVTCSPTLPVRPLYPTYCLLHTLYKASKKMPNHLIHPEDGNCNVYRNVG